MELYSADKIRNVVIMGHSGCGKTTLTEAGLNVAGVTSRLGKVTDGNTVSDYDAEEIRRKVSISASIIPIEWLDNKINFIDTPGYFDFVGEVKQAVSVADIALIVVSAKSGVEVGTEKAWEYADEMNIPKIVFINGMDDENADFDKVVEELKEKFGKSIAPIQIPFKEGGKFAGYLNVIEQKAYNANSEPCATPSGLESEIELMRGILEEAIAETNDDLMEKFFNEEHFTAAELETGVKTGCKMGSVTPVLCGVATGKIGVKALMDSLIQFVPPTNELRKTASAKNAKTNEDVTIECSEQAPMTAFVFKTIADPYVGRLSIFKVTSGIMKRDTPLYNPRQDSTEKAGHLYVIRGKEQIEVSELRAGDIGAIAKLQYVSTQDTLCSKEYQVYHSPIDFPESLLTMAIIPKTKGDEDKIGQAISKVLEEDRTVKFEINAETKQAVISGVGDNQLDVVVNKLKSKYKLDVDLLTPIVPYREMIKSKIRVQGKHKKQSGGHGQYGDVHMEFEPADDPSVEYVFEEKIFGGAVPRQYFPAVEKGIQECVKAGPLAGYPVVGIKATLVDGSYHAVDSSEMAFKLATAIAFKEGFMKAKPTILEPIARVEVMVPDEYTGDIMGDLNKRRGRILGMDKVGTKQRVSAEAPVAEMLKYTTDLRSMTQGRGTYTQKFERYDEAPSDVQAKVIEARKKQE